MQRLFEHTPNPEEHFQREVFEGQRPPVELSHLEKLVEGDPGLTRLLEDIRVQSARYAEALIDLKLAIKAEHQGSREEQEEIDRLHANERRSHDALHDSIDILERNMEQRGKDTTWFEPFTKNRGLYTRFALIITFEMLQNKRR